MQRQQDGLSETMWLAVGDENTAARARHDFM